MDSNNLLILGFDSRQRHRIYYQIYTFVTKSQVQVLICCRSLFAGSQNEFGVKVFTARNLYKGVTPEFLISNIQHGVQSILKIS
jgi:hypothetical protein